MNNEANHRALIHGSTNHLGQRAFTVWVYDTNKPRSGHQLFAKYAAVKMLDVCSTLVKAERVIAKAGLELLAP
jgi:hypothetical protein